MLFSYNTRHIEKSAGDCQSMNDFNLNDEEHFCLPKPLIFLSHWTAVASA